mgnify:CR=1 FL=1
MNKQKGRSSGALFKINAVFYKQFAPNGAILVPSGRTVCRKSKLPKASSRGATC